MKMKKFISSLVALIMVIGIVFVPNSGFVVEAEAVSLQYDADKAIAEAKRQLGISNGDLCAAFVSRCIIVGGINIKVQAITSNLRDAILKETGLDLVELKLNSNGHATKADNGNILAAGDFVIQHCKTHNLSPHVLLCGGYNSNGIATYYGKNNPLNNGTYNLSRNLSNDHTTSCDMVGQVISLHKLNCTSHTYDEFGICTKCNMEFPITFTSTAQRIFKVSVDSAPVRNRPYAPVTINKYLPRNTEVTVIASGYNSRDNLWHKLIDNTWIFDGNLTFVRNDTVVIPPPPTGFTAAHTSGNNARLSWNAVSGATSYQVQWKRSGIDWRDSTDYNTDRTRTSFTITGLTNPPYEFRVRATNSAGSSGWVTVSYNPNSSTASTSITLTPPTGFTAAHTTGNNARLSWNAVSGATSYQVQWKRSGIDWRDSTDYNTDRTRTSFTITGLTNPPYEFRVRAINSTGSSDWVSVSYNPNSSASTSPTVSQPTAPTGFSATHTTGNNAWLSWNAVSGATSYQVQWRRSGIDWRDSTDYNTDRTRTSFTITGLTNPPYEFRVRATNSAGSSDWVVTTYSITQSNDVSFSVVSLLCEDCGELEENCECGFICYGCLDFGCPGCGFCFDCDWNIFGIRHCILCGWGEDCLNIEFCYNCNVCLYCCYCGYADFLFGFYVPFIEYTINDAIEILRAVSGIIVLTPEQEAMYDLDGNGAITVDDALIILRKVAGLI